MRATIPAGLDRKEAEAYSRLDPEQLPKHIAIIMDGNGRWARNGTCRAWPGTAPALASVRSTVETASAHRNSRAHPLRVFGGELEEASQDGS